MNLKEIHVITKASPLSRGGSKAGFYYTEHEDTKSKSPSHRYRHRKNPLNAACLTTP